MAVLTGADIWGPDGEEDMKRQLVALEEARINVERAVQAGLDMGTQLQELDAAKAKLTGLVRVYYPNMAIPAVAR